jgi:hypothetical protein
MATVRRVAAPGFASVNPQRRNSASASAAASYKEDAETSTAWVNPSQSLKDTVQVRKFGHATGVGEQKENLWMSLRRRTPPRCSSNNSLERYLKTNPQRHVSARVIVEVQENFDVCSCERAHFPDELLRRSSS